MSRYNGDPERLEDLQARTSALEEMVRQLQHQRTQRWPRSPSTSPPGGKTGAGVADKGITTAANNAGGPRHVTHGENDGPPVAIHIKVELATPEERHGTGNGDRRPPSPTSRAGPSTLSEGRTTSTGPARSDQKNRRRRRRRRWRRRRSPQQPQTPDPRFPTFVPRHRIVREAFWYHADQNFYPDSQDY